MVHLLHVILGVAALLTLASTGGAEREVMLAHDPADIFRLREGDIIFRRGVGHISDMVALASSQDGGVAKWTHVGVVVSLPTGLGVVHAINDRGVVIDSVWRFFSSAESSHGTAVRMDRGGDIAREALRLVGLPYDSKFDHHNRDEVYCTELVMAALEQAGFDINVLARPVFFRSIFAVFPDDLYQALSAMRPSEKVELS